MAGDTNTNTDTITSTDINTKVDDSKLKRTDGWQVKVNST